MEKYCSNCGSKLNEMQNVCLKCGVLLKNEIDNKKKSKRNHNDYIKTTSIIMIIIGAIIIGFSIVDVTLENSYLYANKIPAFILSGILTVVSGILALCSNKNNIFLLISGILYIVGAIINFIGIVDISLYIILAVVFGIFNIIYSREKNN